MEVTMYVNTPADSSRMRAIKYLFSLAVKGSLIVMITLLLCPTIGAAEGPITPTETLVKPTGTAETAISIWLPEDAVKDPFTAVTDYIAEKDLPEGVSYPPFTLGQAFTFGLWMGDGTTISQFTPSIVINTKYEDSDLDVLPPTRPDEERLHLMMYDPATQSWVKLCSSVDVHENVVSAALSFPTPLDGKGSSLMALALDDSSTLNQAVDAQGNTTISLKGSNLGFQVLVDTVENGSHFAITPLPNISDSGTVQLFSRPIDIKGCRIDHNNPAQNNRQLSVYPKPLKVGFHYDSDTLSRAGGKSNLTIVNLKNSLWIDEEALGFRVVRDNDVITVDTLDLGTFGMAAR